MKIAFHIYHFTPRGSEVATFDYAYYNQKLLNNESIIVSPKIRSQPDDLTVVFKFEKEFRIFEYKNIDELEELCKKEKVDAFYVLKYGVDDKLQLKNIPTWVHCVFKTEEFHGSVYAGVSDSVSLKNNEGKKYPVVNHVVYLPDITSDYRKELNIPQESFVFGRHGGDDTFNIPFVKNAILRILEERKDVWFIFCVKPRLLNDIIHPRLLFLESFFDTRIKKKFINTCDAMIHACLLGESFGLSVLEFAFCGKPVITWNGGLWHKQHLSNLGDKALIYNNEIEVYNIMKNLSKQYIQKINFKIDSFNPENIMNQFKSVFIDTK